MQTRLKAKKLLDQNNQSREMSGVPDCTPDTEREGTRIPKGRRVPRPRPNPDGQKDSGDGQTDTSQPHAETPDLVPPEPPSDGEEEEEEELTEEEFVEGGIHIASREEVADLLGLSHITGPIGTAQEVAELTVEEALEQFALPPNHITELRAAFEDTLAAVPWPRRVPRNLLTFSGRLMDNQIVHQEEDMRLVMALVMAGKGEIALAVGLNSLVRAEKARADGVRRQNRAEVPNARVGAPPLLSQEEQSRLTRRSTSTRQRPPRRTFFREQQVEQQPTTGRQERGRSQSRVARAARPESAAPNSQGPRRH